MTGENVYEKNGGDETAAGWDAFLKDLLPLRAYSLADVVAGWLVWRGVERDDAFMQALFRLIQVKGFPLEGDTRMTVGPGQVSGWWGWRWRGVLGKDLLVDESHPVKQRPRPGRPMKYEGFLRILADETVYCPASIVDHGMAMGIWKPSDDGDQGYLDRLRVRHSLARFSKNHGFPNEGDGLVVLQNQAPVRGWFGWRWKGALD